jgi:hypothetical protein
VRHNGPETTLGCEIAGAALAAELTAKALADGCTMHIIDAGPMTILPHMRKLGYNPLTNFTPISMVGDGGVVVVLPTF